MSIVKTMDGTAARTIGFWSFASKCDSFGVAVFLEPIKGGWGRQGWTRVILAATDELTLRSALTTAWRNVAPAKLRKAHDQSIGNGEAS